MSEYSSGTSQKICGLVSKIIVEKARAIDDSLENQIGFKGSSLGRLRRSPSLRAGQFVRRGTAGSSSAARTQRRKSARSRVGSLGQQLLHVAVARAPCDDGLFCTAAEFRAAAAAVPGRRSASRSKQHG